ncbi:hypothetical protein A0U40_09720 [[Bacillus] sp. KCTC 13219]|nr:hypothetical protein A0U40_09720 [[Bacillus] sp. KCTC 13219]
MAYSRSHANRGMTLEMLIDMTNNMYRNGGKADVDKVPTPVKILKVEKTKVTGHLDTPKWVDYVGISAGKPIIFDAKETHAVRLPLKNISLKQYEKLKRWYQQGAASFLLVAFWIKGKNEPEVYLLNFEQLAAFYEAPKTGRGTKSIKLDFFRENCTRIGSEGGYAVNYLKALERNENDGKKESK